MRGQGTVFSGRAGYPLAGAALAILRAHLARRPMPLAPNNIFVPNPRTQSGGFSVVL
jgi:hypothetical protein